MVKSGASRACNYHLAPFDESRPSPIVPLRITLDDLDAILAYVATIEPAQLSGAPKR